MSDLLLDENQDLKIVNGDFVVGDAMQQHIQSFLLSNKGDWKQHPLVGVGIKDFRNAPLTRPIKTKLEKSIIIQLQSDGFKVSEVKVRSWEDFVIKATKNEAGNS